MDMKQDYALLVMAAEHDWHCKRIWTATNYNQHVKTGLQIFRQSYSSLQWGTDAAKSAQAQYVSAMCQERT